MPAAANTMDASDKKKLIIAVVIILFSALLLAWYYDFLPSFGKGRGAQGRPGGAGGAAAVGQLTPQEQKEFEEQLEDQKAEMEEHNLVPTGS